MRECDFVSAEQHPVQELPSQEFQCIHGFRCNSDRRRKGNAAEGLRLEHERLEISAGKV